MKPKQLETAPTTAKPTFVGWAVNQSAEADFAKAGAT